MSKLAKTDHPIHPFLQKRWSPRAFDSRPVEVEKLLSLLEAARWAASSRNEQPWNFIVGTKDAPEDYDKLLACLNENNAKWAGNAPVLMLAVAKSFFGDSDNPNRSAWHDVGLAMGNLIVQATSMDLYVHMMGGFNRDKARDAFNIPEQYEPVVSVAVGYLGDVNALPEESMRERELAPRPRKPLAEFVFSGEWGRKAEIVRSFGK